jgi:hypothetical protein
MTNEKPNLDALAKAGTHAQTAAKPATVDLSDLYGEHGGKVLDAPTQAKDAEPVHLSNLYGEHGGLVWTPPAAGSEPVDLSSLYGERGGLLQTQTTADEPSDEE